MWGMITALVSGALMSIQGVFNSAVMKQTSMWVSAGWVQISAFVVCLLMWLFTGRGAVSELWQIEPRYMLTGGVIGALFGHKLPAKINSELTKIFGVCSMGMGVSSIGLMKNMPAVIFAVIIGTAFGLAVNLGGIINGGATYMEKPVGKLFPNKNKSMSREEYMSMLVTIIVLFCASGTGIYGSLDSGMSGDHTILISKSILDFFTAMIFGGTLGMVVAAVAIPQCVIFLIIFAAAKFIFPLTTPDMIADFKACGGFLLLATGFRIAKIHDFPVADMIPAMVLVMPVSWFWVNMIVPML